MSCLKFVFFLFSETNKQKMKRGRKVRLAFLHHRRDKQLFGGVTFDWKMQCICKVLF